MGGSSVEVAWQARALLGQAPSLLKVQSGEHPRSL